MNLVAPCPVVLPIRSQPLLDEVNAWPHPPPVLPMPPSHLVRKGAGVVGRIVHGYPFTYVTLDPVQMNARDTAGVANLLENLYRNAGVRWAATFVADRCPYVSLMPRLGYTPAAGKLFWKEL